MLSSRHSSVPARLFAAVVACTLSVVSGMSPAVAQALTAPASRVMTLLPPTSEERAAEASAASGTTSRIAPEGFREFGTARTGQVLEPKTLTLHFAAPAALKKIQSTPDFKIEQGGSCVEGYSYAANSTCTLLVRFTPQGPGRRTGRVTVTNSVDATPLAFGIGGNGSSPAVSFTPSIIATVPGTYVSGAGIIKGASNLVVDKSDTLYIADTGNNAVRYMDSSGTFSAITSGVTAPAGVVVDNFGQIYFTEPSLNKVLETFDYETTAFQINGSGTDGCTYTTTPACHLSSEQVSGPAAMAIDASGQLYFTDNYYGAATFTPITLTMTRISGPFYSQSSTNGFAVDASGNLYTGWLLPGQLCQIMYQSYSNAYYFSDAATKVAGGRTCGFSGDGGQAGNAEIGTAMGQIAFDIAGNLYFTDSSNQRVRRIDALTGIITTIAGNGSIGYSGDNGPATSATLNAPTGVGVDSQGQVYILSSASASGTTQMVRKVGTVGALNLGGIAVGSSSTAQTVTVANTGNANLDYTHVGLNGGNASDFAIDLNTTTCNFTVPLASGHSCKIGFIFTPSATGARATTLTMTDDTVTGVNTIQLSGTGATTATLTPASLTYSSTTVGSAAAAQTATLTNTGKAAMTVSSILISGTGATSYSKTTSCGATLAVGANCTISVTFKPTTTGTLTATLTVSDNALNGHQAVSLTGAGVAAVAKATLAPTILTFPSQKVGSTSAAQTIKLSSTGTASLGVTSIKMAGTTPGDYVLANNCGTSVAAGSSCTITVSFEPTATGTRSASVSVVTSAGTITAAVSGTATAAAAAKKTVVTLTAPSGSPEAGQTVVLSAHVSGGSKLTPTGVIQLWEASHLWTVTSLNKGSAAFEMESLPVGIHLLTAVYLGSGPDAGSRSVPLHLVVRPSNHLVDWAP